MLCEAVIARDTVGKRDHAIGFHEHGSLPRGNHRILGTFIAPSHCEPKPFAPAPARCERTIVTAESTFGRSFLVMKAKSVGTTIPGSAQTLSPNYPKKKLLPDLFDLAEKRGWRIDVLVHCFRGQAVIASAAILPRPDSGLERPRIGFSARLVHHERPT